MEKKEPLEPAPVEESAESELKWSINPPNRPRKVVDGMWSPLEIGTVTVTALILFGVLAAYFLMVAPSNRELENNRADNARLENEQITARSRYGEMTDTETQVSRIVASVDDFETRFLPAIANGRPALYQRLNSLITAYGLINTSGPDYTPLEITDQGTAPVTDADRGRAKYRSIYPGIYVTTTVEGSYQNIRRFLREIETGREFIVVSSVQLLPSDTQVQRRETAAATNHITVPANPIAGMSNSRFPQSGMNPNVQMAEQAPSQPKQQGKMHGELVTLSIELAAYFRRPNFAPMTPEVPAQ